MFIIAEPYTSDFLLKTLERNRFEVLANKTSLEYKKSYNLNIIDDITALVLSPQKVYLNSENQLGWILNNYRNSELSNLITALKDKVQFRHALAPLFPDFFFKEVPFSRLESVVGDDLKFPLIIKPSVGFLSLGVYKVKNRDELITAIESIYKDSKNFTELFPNNVINTSSFIIEEVIEGTEYALDAYYDESGKQVILNVFMHPFANDSDVSDRVYATSKEIVLSNLKEFNDILEKIGNMFSIKNFPMHIEVIKRPDGKIIPVEINPCRFAGWCTTDLAYNAWGINVYEYFMKDLKPDWEKIMQDKKDEIYYFAMAETNGGEKTAHGYKFNYDKFLTNFACPLEVRKIDYTKKPFYAIVFAKANDMQEIKNFLRLDFSQYLEKEAN